MIDAGVRARNAATALHGERTAQDELRVTLRNDLDEVARVDELVGALLERRGVGEHATYATRLALEEALSNVIRHAYPDRGRHEIALTLKVRAGVVELEIVDDGREFDPIAAPEPELDVPLALRRAGGLGIHLLRAFVREMRYERRGARNALSLVI